MRLEVLGKGVCQCWLDSIRIEPFQLGLCLNFSRFSAGNSGRGIL